MLHGCRWCLPWRQNQESPSGFPSPCGTASPTPTVQCAAVARCSEPPNSPNYPPPQASRNGCRETRGWRYLSGICCHKIDLALNNLGLIRLSVQIAHATSRTSAPLASETQQKNGITNTATHVDQCSAGCMGPRRLPVLNCSTYGFVDRRNSSTDPCHWKCPS